MPIVLQTVTDSQEHGNIAGGENLIDTHVDYEVKNRDLIPVVPAIDMIVKNDTSSKMICIKINRYFDDVDLSLKKVQIAYMNGLGETGTVSFQPSEVSVFNDMLFVHWTITSELTKAEGKLKFQLRFIDYTQIGETQYINYLWQTKIQEITILPNLYMDSSNTPLPYNYTVEKAFYSSNLVASNYSIFNDDGAVIDIKNRTISSISGDVVLLGDNNSQLITYKLPKTIDGVPLSNKVIAIKYKLPSGKTDRIVAVNLDYDSDPDYLTFGWLLNSKLASEAGTVQYAVEVLGYLDYPSNNKFYSWQTKTSTLSVLPSLIFMDEFDTHVPNWVTQELVRINELVVQANEVHTNIQQAIVNLTETRFGFFENRPVLVERPMLYFAIDKPLEDPDRLTLTENGVVWWSV